MLCLTDQRPCAAEMSGARTSKHGWTLPVKQRVRKSWRRCGKSLRTSAWLPGKYPLVRNVSDFMPIMAGVWVDGRRFFTTCPIVWRHLNFYRGIKIPTHNLLIGYVFVIHFHDRFARA